MTYSNENVRRQDRLLDEESARNLLAKCEYGVLSMVDDEGGAYGLPISFVWDGGEYIYLHCAPVGHKLRSIRATCIVLCGGQDKCTVVEIHHRIRKRSGTLYRHYRSVGRGTYECPTATTTQILAQRYGGRYAIRRAVVCPNGDNTPANIDIQRQKQTCKSVTAPHESNK